MKRKQKHSGAKAVAGHDINALHANILTISSLYKRGVFVPDN